MRGYPVPIPAQALLARYCAALAQRRALRSLPPQLSFDETFEYARRSIGITQEREEIQNLWTLVRTLRPTTVVEIGVDEGGTLFLWTRASAADAQLIAIDMRPSGRLGRWSPFQLVRRSFARGHQRLHLLLGRDSHAQSTLEAVRELLDGAEVDFLFIDGDHSYEGVQLDFDLYAPLVRNGGVIALHDIWPAGGRADTSRLNDGVVRYWQELVAKHETSEFTVRSPDGFGIGVVHVRR